MAGRRSAEATPPPGWLRAVPCEGPLLLQARALTARASEVGFDWPNVRGVQDKVDEELRELRAALADGEGPERVEAELGDLLLALTNLSRFVGVDPQAALSGALARFRTRFAGMEAALAQAGLRIQEQPLETLEELWQHQKRAASGTAPGTTGPLQDQRSGPPAACAPRNDPQGGESP